MEGARRPRSSGSEPFPRSSTRRATRSTSRPPSSWTRRSGMLGGGGELVVQLVAALEPEGPELRADLHEAAGRRSRRSSGSAPRSGTRSSPRPTRTPSPWARISSAGAHHEHALTASAPELWRYGLHLQEETEASWPRWQRMGGGAVARAGGGAERRPGVGCAPAGLPCRAGPGARLRRRAGAGEHSADPVDVVARVPPRRAGAVRGLRAAADLPVGADRPVLRHPARRSAPAEVRARQRRGHCRHAIPAMVAHEAYPGHHLQLVTAQGLGPRCGGTSGPRPWWKGWALYCEQLMDESYTVTTRRGSSAW